VPATHANATFMTRDRQPVPALPVRASRGAGLRVPAALPRRPHGLLLLTLRLP